MPDVGVLNLQIHDNSEAAVSGLKNLAGALERVRDIVKDVKLSPVANSIKRIGEAVDKYIHNDTLDKLGRLSDELSKLRGLGNLNIKINGGNDIEKIRDAILQAKDAIHATDAGFNDIGMRAFQARDGVEGFNGAVRDAEQLMESRAWAHGVDEFGRLFDSWNRFRMSFALPAGEMVGVSTEVERGWTMWKDGAIEVEGTVTDAMDEVNARLGEPIQYLTGMASQLGSINDYLGDTNDLMEHLAKDTSPMSSGENAIIVYKENVQEATQATRECVQAMEEIDETGRRAIEFAKEWNASKPRSLSLDETNQMADTLTQLHLLTAQLREAEQQYNEFVNKFGAGSSKAIKAGLKVSDLRDKIWEYKQALDGARNSEEEMAEAQEQHISVFARLKDGIERMFPTLAGMFKRFGQIVKYRMLRSVLRYITAGFSEGVKNVYQYSKAVGTDLAPAMDEAKAVLLQMKNSIGAAVAPLIQTLVPVLKTVVNWFVTAVNWANQFISILSGQNTWTRAIAAQTDAYADQTRSAAASAKEAKDMLADFDELNIIQSDSGSGGGGGGAGSAAEEYTNMFEQVDHFSSKIKEIADFISDHMGGVLGLVEAIGAAILGWKLSRAFEGFLGQLGDLILGGALVVIGLEISYGAGFEAGRKGYFDGKDLLEGALGIIATAIGGAVIAGPAGAAIGIGVSLVLTGIGFIEGSIDARDESRWGNVHLTSQQIQRHVESMFTFDVEARINLLNTNIDNLQEAEDTMRSAIRKFSASFSSTKSLIDLDVGIDVKAESLKEASDDALSAINSIIEYIQSVRQSLKVTIGEFKLVDDNGTDLSGIIMSATEGTSTLLEEYFRGLGSKISGWILKGEQSGWQNGEMEQAMALMASQQRILDKYEELRQKRQFRDTVSGSTGRIKIGQDGMIDRESALAEWQFSQQQLNEYEQTVRQNMAEQLQGMHDIADMAFAVAQEEAAQGRGGFKYAVAGMTQEMVASQFERTMEGQIQADLRSAKDMMYEYWGGLLKVIYGEDYMDSLNEKTNPKKQTFYIWDKLLDPLIGSMWSDAKRSFDNAYNKNGKEGAIGWLRDVVLESLSQGDPNGLTRSILETLGQSGFGFLGEDAKHMLMQNLVGLLGGDSDLAAQVFAEAFEIPYSQAREYLDEVDMSGVEQAVSDTVDDVMKDVSTGIDLWHELFTDIPVPELDLTAFNGSLNEMYARTVATMNAIQAILGMSGLITNNIHLGLQAQPRGFASGGFVRSGDLVMANENGNFEMMGRMGNQPVVANNQQIVNGITQGVSQANGGVESRLNVIEGLLQQVLRKEFVARAVPTSDWGAHQAKSASKFERVTG